MEKPNGHKVTNSLTGLTDHIPLNGKNSFPVSLTCISFMSPPHDCLMFSRHRFFVNCAISTVQYFYDCYREYIQQLLSSGHYFSTI